MDNSSLNDLARKLADGVPGMLSSLKADAEVNFRSILQSVLGKFDLTTREEFDVQTRVLQRSREQIVALEARVAALEAKLHQ